MVERLDADAATAATGLEATSSAQVRILFLQGHVLSLCAKSIWLRLSIPVDGISHLGTAPSLICYRYRIITSVIYLQETSEPCEVEGCSPEKVSALSEAPQQDAAAGTSSPAAAAATPAAAPPDCGGSIGAAPGSHRPEAAASPRPSAVVERGTAGGASSPVAQWGAPSAAAASGAEVPMAVAVHQGSSDQGLTLLAIALSIGIIAILARKFLAAMGDDSLADIEFV